MSARKLIWVLEDEETVIKLYKEALVIKYQVKFLKSLKEFLEALHGSSPQPDLLISDLILEDESFVEILNEPKNLKLMTFPFLIVSGSGDIDVMRDCFKFGATDFLCKPFKSPEVLIKVERALKSISNPVVFHSPTDGFIVDQRLMTISCENGPSVSITVKELQIFNELNQQISQGQKVLRKNLIEGLKEIHLSMNSLDVHLSRLRKKLEAIGYGLEYNELNGYSFKKLT